MYQCRGMWPAWCSSASIARSTAFWASSSARQAATGSSLIVSLMPTTATRTLEGIELPAPGTWTIDPGHAEIVFIGRHFMLTKVRGRFTRVQGAITVADDPARSQLQVTIKQVTHPVTLEVDYLGHALDPITQVLFTVMSPDPVETVMVRVLAESTRTPTSRVPDPVSAWTL